MADPNLAVSARDHTLNELMGTDSWFIGALGQRVLEHGGLHLEIEKGLLQRWNDHGQVHESDKAALNKALEQADKALLAALEAHRREHLIAEAGQIREAATHQTQHLALNELRTVVGDVTSKFAPIEAIGTLTTNWDRRWDERQKEEATFRTQLQSEEQTYRGQVRQDIASLRESRSEGTGSKVQVKEAQTQNNWLVTAALAVVAVLIAFVGLIIELSRAHP